jgi:hypothetical protein
MNIEEALAIVESLLKETTLNDLQEVIFRQCWEQKTYPEIAQNLGYDADYVKLVGCQLWKKLSDVLGIKVTKNNFRSALKRQAKHYNNNRKLLIQNPKSNPPISPLTKGGLKGDQDWGLIRT